MFTATTGLLVKASAVATKVLVDMMLSPNVGDTAKVSACRAVLQYTASSQDLDVLSHDAAILAAELEKRNRIMSKKIVDKYKKSRPTKVVEQSLTAEEVAAKLNACIDNVLSDETKSDLTDADVERLKIQKPEHWQMCEMLFCRRR